jgi:hypothetical protein
MSICLGARASAASLRTALRCTSLPPVGACSGPSIRTLARWFNSASNPSLASSLFNQARGNHAAEAERILNQVLMEQKGQSSVHQEKNLKVASFNCWPVEKEAPNLKTMRRVNFEGHR